MIQRHHVSVPTQWTSATFRTRSEYVVNDAAGRPLRYHLLSIEPDHLVACHIGQLEVLRFSIPELAKASCSPEQGICDNACRFRHIKAPFKPAIHHAARTFPICH